MTAFRHLRFVMRMFGPPTNGIWWSLSLCKIWLESISSFDNMQVLIFCNLGLKRPFTTPKSLFGFDPQNGSSRIATPKGHFLARKHVIRRIDRLRLAPSPQRSGREPKNKVTRNSSEDEIANVNYFATTSVHEFDETTQNKRHYAVQGHSRSPILVPIECFLLVINTNLPLILQRFRDIAFERSKIAVFGYPTCI